MAEFGKALKTLPQANLDTFRYLLDHLMRYVIHTAFSIQQFIDYHWKPYMHVQLERSLTAIKVKTMFNLHVHIDIVPSNYTNLHCTINEKRRKTRSLLI